VIAQVGQHPRLVDDDVRELRQTLLDVLDAPGADDPVRVVGVGSPEGRLVDPVRLAQQAVGEAERLEHLHRPARDAVRLTDLERPVPAIDDHGRQIREARELRGEDEAGGAAADDEHVGFLREAGGPFGDGRMGILDERVAGVVAVEMELHGPAFLPTRGRGVASGT
jgi:hypothetical protein